jgi:hypothetical protein
MSAAWHKDHDDVVPDLEVIHTGTELLDDAGGFVS